MRRLRYAIIFLLACGPVAPGDDGEGSSTGVEPAASTGTSTTNPTSGGVGSSGPGSEGTGVMDPGSTASSNDVSGFLDSGDVPPFPDHCNQFIQDCPAGEKCMPYADDGGGSWNNLKCTPVVDDPGQLYEPCFDEDVVDGMDSCDVGLMCWDTDLEGNGICFGMCMGFPEAPTCEDPLAQCAIYSEAILTLCLKGCDPLLQDCDPSDVCIGNPNGEVPVRARRLG